MRHETSGPFIIVVRADDVVPRRGYNDQFVTMCVYVCRVCMLAQLNENP